MEKLHAHSAEMFIGEDVGNSVLCASPQDEIASDEVSLWGAHEETEVFVPRSATRLPAFSYSLSEKEAFEDSENGTEPLRGRLVSSSDEAPWWRVACRHRLLTADEEKQLAARIQSSDESALITLVESNYRLVVRIAGRYQRLRSRALTLEDLFQEGCIGLMHAARKFDPKRGVRFSTYAVPWVQQCMARALIRQERLVRLPEGLEREQQSVERTMGTLAQSLGRCPTQTEVAASLSESGRNLLSHPVNFDYISLDAPISTHVNSDSWADILPDERTDTANDAVDHATREVIRLHIARALCGLTDQQATVIRLRYGLDQAPMTLVAIASILGVTPERVRQLERTALRNMRRSEHLSNWQKDELEEDGK